MNTPDPSLLAEVLRHALDGIAIVDGAGGAPRVVYANATLAALLRPAACSRRSRARRRLTRT